MTYRDAKLCPYDELRLAVGHHPVPSLGTARTMNYDTHESAEGSLRPRQKFQYQRYCHLERKAPIGACSISHTLLVLSQRSD
jgi:hypothetical protein